MPKKTCDRCKQSLNETRFEIQTMRNGNKYRRNICKTCYQEKRNRARSNDPKSYMRSLFTQAKSARKKQGVVWELELDDLYELWDEQEGKCAESNIFMTWKKGGGAHDLNISIDRVTPNGPYSRSNVQLVCLRVNLMKQTLSGDEFYWWCKNIVTTKEKF